MFLDFSYIWQWFWNFTFSWFSTFGNLIKVAIPPARCRSWGLIGSFNFLSNFKKLFEKFRNWNWTNFCWTMPTPKILLENDNILDLLVVRNKLCFLFCFPIPILFSNVELAVCLYAGCLLCNNSVLFILVSSISSYFQTDVLRQTLR